VTALFLFFPFESSPFSFEERNKTTLPKKKIGPFFFLTKEVVPFKPPKKTFFFYKRPSKGRDPKQLPPPKKDDERPTPEAQVRA
jgi:hypothetical protein